MSLETTVQELRRLKMARSRERALRDLEERALLDDLADTNKELRGSPRSYRRNKVQLSKDKDIRDIQIQVSYLLFH